MNIVFAALAVFWLIRLVQTWIDAPRWLWMLIGLALSSIALLPWDGYAWYTPGSVAAIVAFLQMAENFLIAKSDEALTSIIRRR